MQKALSLDLFLLPETVMTWNVYCYGCRFFGSILGAMVICPYCGEPITALSDASTGDLCDLINQLPRCTALES